MGLMTVREERLKELQDVKRLQEELINEKNILIADEKELRKAMVTNLKEIQKEQDEILDNMEASVDVEFKPLRVIKVHGDLKDDKQLKFEPVAPPDVKTCIVCENRYPIGKDVNNITKAEECFLISDFPKREATKIRKNGKGFGEYVCGGCHGAIVHQ